MAADPEEPPLSDFERYLLPVVVSVILGFVTTAEARTLRLARSTLRDAVTAQPWTDAETSIVDVPR